jgi:hypothetical protein
MRELGCSKMPRQRARINERCYPDTVLLTVIGCRCLAERLSSPSLRALGVGEADLHALPSHEVLLPELSIS